MSNQNFSGRLSQALKNLSDLNLSDDEHETSKPSSEQTDPFSDRLQSLLSQLVDSPGSSDSESAFLDDPQLKHSLVQKREAPDEILQTLSKVASAKRKPVPTNRPLKRKYDEVSSSEEEPSNSESSEEDLTHSKSPGGTPERTEDEFVPESPEIIYQFIDGEGNEELGLSEPAGEQPLLLNCEDPYLI